MDNAHESSEILIDLSSVQSQPLDQLRSRVREFQNSAADGIVFDLYRTNYLISSVLAPNEARSLRDNQLERDQFRSLHEEFHSDSFAILPRVFDPQLVHWYSRIPDARRVLTHGGDITYKRLLESLGTTDLMVLLTIKASQSDTIRRALGWLGNDNTILIHEEYVQPPGTLGRLSILRSQFELNTGLADPSGRYERIEPLFSCSLSYWIPRLRPDSDETGWTPGDLESIKERLNRNHDAAHDEFEGTEPLRLDERDRDYQNNQRRSLMADCSLAAGSTLEKGMIRELRPGNGLPAEEIDTVTGMIVQRPTDPQEMISY